MNRLLLALSASAISLGALAGCNMDPKYQRPDPPVPGSWPAGDAYQNSTPATAPAARDLPWQEFIADPRLRQIIQMALENNRDLRLAALNVERTRALYRIQRAELYPNVDITGSHSRQRLPGDLSPSGEAATIRQYGVNVGITAWELDFFGRIRSFERSALQEFFASQQARQSAQILLISGAAETYLALAADRENQKLAQTTLEGQLAALDLVQKRFDRGATPELDVHRARAQVETARAALVRYTQRIAEDENALNRLAGAPVPRELQPAHLADVPALREISPGMSSEVLLSRPDVLEAEHRLKAAYANIGAARAAFFPRISLTASAGTASSELSGLFGDGSGTWNFAPRIVMPIFDARTWAAKDVSEVEQQLALTQYERAIQTSFREVADALAVRGTVDQQLAAEEALVNAMAETYRLSNIRYERGVESYLSVLDAQRFLYAAQQELVGLRFTKVANQVRLYAVLGGGWQPPAAPQDR